MKHILVANDLTERSVNALTRAIRLAATHGAAIRIVHAAPDSEAKAYLSTRRKLQAQAQALAVEITGRPREFSIRISCLDAAHAILREARRFDADLILLGAHGEPRFRDAIFGTTATHIVRHGEWPVLTVQNDDFPYSRVLAAVDDPAAARPLFEAMLDIAPAAEVFAVHAFYPSLRQTLAGQAELDRLEDLQERDIEAILNEVAAGRTQDLSASNHAIVESGEVLDVLMTEAERLQPDLVAMGTRRRATYLGSHAVDTLFWCPQDVLVVPERETVVPKCSAKA